MPTNENNFGDLTPRQDFDVATGDTKRTLLAERNKEFHKPSLLERDGTRFRSTVVELQAQRVENRKYREESILFILQV